MFCTNCGSKLYNGAYFCSNCGEKVTAPAQQAQQCVTSNASYGLPEGMAMTPEGKIWWSYTDKKDEYLYQLDDKMIVVYHKVAKKDSATLSFARDIINFATVHSDTLTFMDEPFPEGDNSNVVIINGNEYYHNPIEFRYLRAIKEDSKHSVIKLHNTYWWSIHTEGEQYTFFINYILSHCPNIKRK